MNKVRVSDLAKSFGMKGQDFAKLLRDNGFENVKSHMTSLDSADVMMIEARLAAQGMRRMAAEPEAGPATPKKKKLLPAEDAAEPAATSSEPAASGELVKKPLVKKVIPGKKELPSKRSQPSEEQPATPPAPPAPAVVEPVAAAPAPVEVAPVAEPVEPAAPVQVPEPAPEPVAATKEQPPAVVPESEPAPLPEPTVAIEPAVSAVAETNAATATASLPVEAEPVRKLIAPAKRATVVGKIELPQETIRDAKSRSAPATERNLRMQAMQKLQQRAGHRSTAQPGARRGPATRGPSRGQPGVVGTVGKARGKTISTVDPSKVVEVEEPVSLKALSEALGTKVTELIATLTFKLGVAGKNINSFLSNEEVELVALELERKIKVVEHKEAIDELIEQLVEGSAGEAQLQRAPVVTFMGHVDHGKTSLMDALRKSDVVKGEAGGITQHIGAYKVQNAAGQSIVILDTPGHAAFTAMRARGADLTDIVVLVVAGDDGVMPQTEEAINHAKAAKVPIVVAVTKADLPASKPKQVMQQLMIKGLQAEEYGGEIGVVEVSAHKGTGLDALFERILLECEILELNARPDAPGKGVVVESRQSPEQGVVVTLLVTDGTLRLKDQVVCGESFARVRAMIDDKGTPLSEAGPSTPVTLFGLDRLPTPGDKLFVVEDAKKAREVVEERQRRVRELSRAERSAVTLENLSAKLAERNIQEIKLILKADAMGSLEPLRKCLEELSTPEVRVNLVHSALGGISETDVSLASASGAIIVGFHTVADSSARQMAERADVQIRYYEVIYQLLDEVKAAMEGMLAPEEVQTVIGHAEIKAVFKSSKFGTIAGLRVLDGLCKRNSIARLSRDGAVLHSGKVASLRRIDEDVKEVKAGFECGLTLDGYQDLRVGDQLEFVQVELIKRTLGG